MKMSKVKKTIADRYIPEGRTEVKYPEVNAVVYIDGKYGMGFKGKSIKPSFRYNFGTQAKQEAYIAEWIAKLTKNQAENKAYKDETNKSHTVKVGDVLYYSWGYEQSNLDWFQVISTTLKTVKLRQIKSNITLTGFMCGESMPVKDSFIGDGVLIKKVNGKNYASMAFGCLSLWDGKSKYVSWYA
jgi:hypothetical protein